MSTTTKAAFAGTKIQRAFILTIVISNCALLWAGTAGGKLVADNTPSFVATAKDLGAEDPAKVIEVSVWLQPHNRSQFDALAQSLYERASPNYRHWLKPAEVATRLAPTAQEAETVRQFLTAHNLKIVKTGPMNFYVRALGSVGNVQKAFQVQLNNYQVGNKIIRANAADPNVEGEAGNLVRAVSGLDSGEFEHPLVARPTIPGKADTGSATVASTTSSDFYSSQCFTGTEKETFSTGGNGSLPIGKYSGNKINLPTHTSAGCAYTPPSIQTAYNLTGLYNEGYNGAGQTIAILDWCGSFTIQSDANAFSAKFGLPALTSSNFAITYTAPSLCMAYDQVEINLDVEWAHAIAPGAGINLVVPPSADFQDVNQAEFDIVNYGLGTVLSGSFASTELYTPTTELDTENLISEIGAAEGISTNFASGDYGDYGLQTLRSTVSAPADSPWATAVGGVTLALNSDNSIAWQSGWGNNETLLVKEGTVFDPPQASFSGGSGGGPSECVTKNIRFRPPICTGGFPKPAYQQSLPGHNRQLPDVSWLADPYTGAAIVISIPGQLPEQVWQVYGGTSLATPMFSALWAIANQEALAGGGAPLGQAAPYLYTLPTGTVYDIVPVTSATNVTGSILDSNGSTWYTAKELAGVSSGDFVSALWDYEALEDTTLVVSFGTDFGLEIAPGWDNVTGVGTPNAQAFADYFFGK